MAFVFEKVPEEDWDFFRSMGLKDCWGARLLDITKRSKWCADRERNSYLVGIGGGYHDMPYFYDLWWNGNIIRIDVGKRSVVNHDGGINFAWIINKMFIPKKVWKYNDEIVKMIRDALAVKRDWCLEKYLKSILE